MKELTAHATDDLNFKSTFEMQNRKFWYRNLHLCVYCEEQNFQWEFLKFVLGESKNVTNDFYPSNKIQTDP